MPEQFDTPLINKESVTIKKDLSILWYRRWLKFRDEPIFQSLAKFRSNIQKFNSKLTFFSGAAVYFGHFHH